MDCIYCNTKNDTKLETCTACGAPLRKTVTHDIWHEGKFFYNGYIIWWLREESRFMLNVYIYLGDKLVQTLKLPESLLTAFVPNNASVLDFVWDLFKLTQGDEEVLRIQTTNVCKAAVFELRYIKTADDEWMDSFYGLDRRELADKLEYFGLMF